jgi:hypothetical protein
MRDFRQIKVWEIAHPVGAQVRSLNGSKKAALSDFQNGVRLDSGLVRRAAESLFIISGKQQTADGRQQTAGSKSKRRLPFAAS